LSIPTTWSPRSSRRRQRRSNKAAAPVTRLSSSIRSPCQSTDDARLRAFCPFTCLYQGFRLCQRHYAECLRVHGGFPPEQTFGSEGSAYDSATSPVVAPPARSKSCDTGALECMHCLKHGDSPSVPRFTVNPRVRVAGCPGPRDARAPGRPREYSRALPYRRGSGSRCRIRGVCCGRPSDLCDIGHEIVRNSLRILADQAARVGTAGLKYRNKAIRQRPDWRREIRKYRSTISLE